MSWCSSWIYALCPRKEYEPTEQDQEPVPISLLQRPISYDAYMVTVNQRREERRIRRQMEEESKRKKREQKEERQEKEREKEEESIDTE